MPLNITITDAGRAEIINAANTGTAPVEITEVGLGTGQYSPDPAQTALTNEVKRLNTISGEVVADDTIHVTVKDEGGDAYDVAEFGLFTASGTLFAVYSQASGPFMQKAAQSSLLLSVDVILGTLDATNLTFGDTSFSNPPASTSVAGVVELATGGESIAGTDTTRAATPSGVHAAIKSFGVGSGSSILLGQGYDLNTIPSKTAFYGGYEPVNGPAAVGVNIYTLEVYAYSPGWMTQRLNMMTASTVRVFERAWQNNVGWTDWEEVASTGNMPADFSANGWQKLPSGLIIQWINGDMTKGSFVSWPIAFPNAFLSGSATHNGTDNDGTATISSPSASGFIPYWKAATTTLTNFIIAVGY